jgi:hypothetical protein
MRSILLWMLGVPIPIRCHAEDPPDELDVTNNIPLGKPSDLSLSYRVYRLHNRPYCPSPERNHRLAAMRFLNKLWPARRCCSNKERIGIDNAGRLFFTAFTLPGCTQRVCDRSCLKAYRSYTKV